VAAHTDTNTHTQTCEKHICVGFSFSIVVVVVGAMGNHSVEQSASSKQKKGESSNKKRQSLAQHLIRTYPHILTPTHTHRYTHLHSQWEKLTASALMIFFPMQIACGSCSGFLPWYPCTRRAYEYIYLCIYSCGWVCEYAESHTHTYTLAICYVKRIK